MHSNIGIKNGILNRKCISMWRLQQYVVVEMNECEQKERTQQSTNANIREMCCSNGIHSRERRKGWGCEKGVTVSCTATKDRDYVCWPHENTTYKYFMFASITIWLLFPDAFFSPFFAAVVVLLILLHWKRIEFFLYGKALDPSTFAHCIVCPERLQCDDTFVLTLTDRSVAIIDKFTVNESTITTNLMNNAMSCLPWQWKRYILLFQSNQHPTSDHM